MDLSRLEAARRILWQFGLNTFLVWSNLGVRAARPGATLPHRAALLHSAATPLLKCYDYCPGAAVAVLWVQQQCWRSEVYGGKVAPRLARGPRLPGEGHLETSPLGVLDSVSVAAALCSSAARASGSSPPRRIVHVLRIQGLAHSDSAGGIILRWKLLGANSVEIILQNVTNSATFMLQRCT